MQGVSKLYSERISKWLPNSNEHLIFWNNFPFYSPHFYPEQEKIFNKISKNVPIQSVEVLGHNIEKDMI